MNITRKSIQVLGASAAVVTLTFAGASAALAGDDADGGSHPGREARIAKVCENPEQAIAKLTERQTKVNERIAKLTEMRTKASDAGRPELVAKIDGRLERLRQRLAKLTDRLAKAPDWIAEHCS